MSYYVYILLCKDGSYYTGHAVDVKRRIERHMKGQGARYTRMHKPEKIVYLQEFESRREAMEREREIKSFNHSRKVRLVNSHDKTNLLKELAHVHTCPRCA